MFGNPEDARKLVSASHLRVEVSQAAVYELRQCVNDTEHAIRTTKAMIASSDRLIHWLERLYPAAP